MAMAQTLWLFISCSCAASNPHQSEIAKEISSARLRNFRNSQTSKGKSMDMRISIMSVQMGGLSRACLKLVMRGRCCSKIFPLKVAVHRWLKNGVNPSISDRGAKQSLISAMAEMVARKTG